MFKKLGFDHFYGKSIGNKIYKTADNPPENATFSTSFHKSSMFHFYHVSFDII